jgi:hypothetical protein
MIGLQGGPSSCRDQARGYKTTTDLYEFTPITTPHGELRAFGYCLLSDHHAKSMHIKARSIPKYRNTPEDTGHGCMK